MTLTKSELVELLESFRFAKPDRSSIYEWARKHVVLPSSYAISGPFNATLTPWLIPVFDALQSSTVRHVHFRKGIQVGGTLISDILIPWIIVNDPGPIAVTMHVDDMMERHAKMRLNPVLEACKPVAALLPKPGPHRTTTEIHFGGFSLIMNAANLSDQQSQSIRWKINDEIWHRKWADCYADAIGRVSAYEAVGTSKVLNISQAGFENDIEDSSFQSGHRAQWSANCPSCQKSHPLSFQILQDYTVPESEKIGGVTWDQKALGADGFWDIGTASRSTRWACPFCKNEQPDTDATREKWKRSGHYVAKNLSAPRERMSFHVESIVSRPMSLLVEEYLQARNEMTKGGNEEPLIKFQQKREARPWRIERSAVNIISTSQSTYTVEDYFDGTKRAPGETFRAMTIDRQQTHFWIEVGAWSPTPEYTQLFFGRVDTIDQARQVQQQYRILDSCVGEDRRYQPGQTDQDCARFGWRGLAGSTQGRKTWTMSNPATGKLDSFPHSDPKYASIGGNVSVPFYEFSPEHMKDILFNCLNGRGFIWNLPKNCSQTYLEHLKSEVKEQVRPGVWRYVEVKQNANHGIDTSSMMLAIAVIAGLVRFAVDDVKK
jgi:hypothetical protein